MRIVILGPLGGLICAATATLGVVAHAADYTAPPSIEPPRYNWKGFYGGLQGGYVWSDIDTHADWGGGAFETFSYGTKGAIGGIHFGLNQQYDDFVFGLETDFELSGNHGSGVGTAAAIHSTDMDWTGSLRARIGVATDNTLFYVTGGLAYASLTVDQYAIPTMVHYSGVSQQKVGLTIGGGIEHALMAGITTRIEYRYTDLGRLKYTHPTLGMRETDDITSHTVRAGLSFKF